MKDPARYRATVGEPEVISVDIHLTYPAELFGSAASGTLRLRGRLVKCFLWWKSSEQQGTRSTMILRSEQCQKVKER